MRISSSCIVKPAGGMCRSCEKACSTCEVALGRAMLRDGYGMGYEPLRSFCSSAHVVSSGGPPSHC